MLMAIVDELGGATAAVFVTEMTREKLWLSAPARNVALESNTKPDVGDTPAPTDSSPVLGSMSKSVNPDAGDTDTIE